LVNAALGAGWFSRGNVSPGGTAVMSAGELAYLVMVIVGFCVFSVALAWFTHLQSVADRRVRSATPQTHVPANAIGAH
jgi:hypothetical protein